MRARGDPGAADLTNRRHAGAKGRITSALLALLLLTGCASGPPTIELDARAFVAGYLRERDHFVRRTAPAFRKCETLTLLASEPLKVKCDRLREETKVWTDRDAAILDALLTRSPINAETLAAVWAVAERVLVLAADVAL